VWEVAIVILGSSHMSLMILRLSTSVKFTKRAHVVFGRSAFIALTLLVFVLFVQGDTSGRRLGLIFLWYLFFVASMERDNADSLEYNLALSGIVFQLMLLSFLSFLSIGTISVFPEEVGAVVMATTFSLGVYGTIRATKNAKLEQVKLNENKKTINWFSILINLMSHNLKSPLAAISGNVELIMLKNSSIYDIPELKRIQESVKASNEIIHRLLKASLVTDAISGMGLKSSLKQSYPRLIVKGAMDLDIDYQHSVSIHLALEVFLDNAFRYSPDRVHLIMKGESLIVRDFGPGLTDDQLENFGTISRGSKTSLHGIGIPFALRILDSIGYTAIPKNLGNGLEITIEPGAQNFEVPLVPLLKKRQTASSSKAS
jgi:signal transduction histidine kinase